MAEDAMRQELLSDDGPQMYQRVAMHPCIVGLLDRIRSAVEANKSRKEITDLTEAIHLPLLSYDSIAHDAANTSDVASHMPQVNADLFTNIYSIVPQMDRTNDLQAQDLARIQAISRAGGALSEAKRMQVLVGVETLRNEDRIMSLDAIWALPRLKKLGELDPGKVSRLMAGARKSYGNCIKDLPAESPRTSP